MQNEIGAVYHSLVFPEEYVVLLEEKIKDKDSEELMVKVQHFKHPELIVYLTQDSFEDFYVQV